MTCSYYLLAAGVITTNRSTRSPEGFTPETSVFCISRMPESPADGDAVAMFLVILSPHGENILVGLFARAMARVTDNRPLDAIAADVNDGECAVWITFGAAVSNHLAHGVRASLRSGWWAKSEGTERLSRSKRRTRPGRCCRSALSLDEDRPVVDEPAEHPCFAECGAEAL